MQIETYEIEEIKSSDASTMAADATALELCEKLGLTGQQKMFGADTGDRLAFPRVTKLQSLVFGTLFPEKAEVSKFNTEIIPLRVLEVLDKAKSSGCFARFDIWHNPTRKDDPILVGHTGEAAPQSWDEHYVRINGTFLLARWGEALAPFEVLAKEAKAIWKAARRNVLKKEIHEKQGHLERLDEDADVAFVTGNEP